MKNKPVITAENISKAYQTGQISSGTLGQDLQNLIRKISTRNKSSCEVTAASSAGNQFWALKNINFEVNRGDIVSLSGPNGAGKSTLLKILSRITSPTTGKISGIGVLNSLLEIGAGFHPELTGSQNIYLNGAILGIRKSEVRNHTDQILQFAGVENFKNTPIKHYSSGMYARLAFSTAAHLHSDILIIDEVLAVGDSNFRIQCLEKLKYMSRVEGRTIIIVSHNQGDALHICNKEIKLNQGQII